MERNVHKLTQEHDAFSFIGTNVRSIIHHHPENIYEEEGEKSSPRSFAHYGAEFSGFCVDSTGSI